MTSRGLDVEEALDEMWLSLADAEGGGALQLPYAGPLPKPPVSAHLCDVCHKAFCSRDFLRRHRKRRHGIEEVDTPPPPAQVGTRPAFAHRPRFSTKNTALMHTMVDLWRAMRLDLIDYCWWWDWHQPPLDLSMIEERIRAAMSAEADKMAAVVATLRCVLLP
jgi:hypothetical protein